MIYRRCIHPPDLQKKKKNGCSERRYFSAMYFVWYRRRNNDLFSGGAKYRWIRRYFGNKYCIYMVCTIIFPSTRYLRDKIDALFPSRDINGVFGIRPGYVIYINMCHFHRRSTWLLILLLLPNLTNCFLEVQSPYKYNHALNLFKKISGALSRAFENDADLD